MALTKQEKQAREERALSHSPYDRKILLLQGGGALGTYQAGAYQALFEADYNPDWVAGISIGSINAAIIAGNPPTKRVQKLRDFWQELTRTFNWPAPQGDLPRKIFNNANAMGAMFFGLPAFFKPRLPGPFLRHEGTREAISFYDTSPLLNTLERYIDFNRLNTGDMRLSLGAVDIETGNTVTFDNTEHRVGPEHILASGSLPPGFPPTEIDGRLYWDGGLVSNTPLGYVLQQLGDEEKNVLIFQVDLWSAQGAAPHNMFDVESRRKSIVYSSRTRLSTDLYRREADMRAAIKTLSEHLPEEAKKDPEIKSLMKMGQERHIDLVHLIYKKQRYETHARDYEFSRASMENHWADGWEDVIHTLDSPDWKTPPHEAANGIRVFDLN